MATGLNTELQPRFQVGSHSIRIQLALCILISLIFMIAAIAKTIGYREMEATLAASRLVPVPAVPTVAASLLSLEYILSFLILVPLTRRTALHSTTILVSSFLAYSTWRSLQGIGIPCSCFGVIFKLELWQSVLLNVLLLVILAYLLTTSSAPKHYRGVPTKGLRP